MGEYQDGVCFVCLPVGLGGIGGEKLEHIVLAPVKKSCSPMLVGAKKF
jgi:hypothetical protein